MLILSVSMRNFCPSCFKFGKVKNNQQQYMLNSTQRLLEIKWWHVKQHKNVTNKTLKLQTCHKHVNFLHLKKLRHSIDIFTWYCNIKFNSYQHFVEVKH